MIQFISLPDAKAMQMQNPPVRSLSLVASEGFRILNKMIVESTIPAIPFYLRIEFLTSLFFNLYLICRAVKRKQRRRNL